MIKVYSDDDIQHAIQVGGNGFYLRRVLEQVYNDRKTVALTAKMFLDDSLSMAKIIEADKEGHAALVKAHRELEESHAELEALLDGVTE